MLDINTILAVTSDEQTCARCGAPIERGFAAGCTWDKHVILHVDCAVDVNAAATANAIRASKAQFRARDALLALALARVKAEADANRSSKKSSESPIEPARDRQGRPRVRVLFVQSEGAERSPTSSFFGVGHLCERWQLRSSVREYVLIFHQYPKHTRIDPSQPFAATMYWQRADKPVATRNAKLVEWRSLGLAPVLVESGREDGLAQGFIGAFKRCSRARADERAHVFKLLAKAAERHPEEIAKTITGIERDAVAIEDRDAVHAVIRALLAVPKKVPPQLERWVEDCMRDDRDDRDDGSDVPRLAKAFRAAIDSADARKAKRLAELAASLSIELPNQE